MKPAAFAWCAPSEIGDAIGLLGRYGSEAKILAGGQTLGPLLNMRLSTPAILIDINAITPLAGWRADSEGTVIGALTRQSTLEDDPRIAALQPIVAEAIPEIAHRTIRNRGTVGGSLAHADPAAEWPAIATLLEAEIIAESSARGTRRISAADFFITHLTTALAPDELLCAVRLPASPPGAGYAMQEFSRRRGDFALAGAMVRLVRSQGGTLREARLVLFGTGKRALRARGAEAMLAGTSPGKAIFAAAAAQAASEIDPYDDLHASAEYRRHLAEVLALRTLEAALARTDGVPDA